MSSATAPSQQHEWIVILPDHPGVLRRRMEVRADHLKALDASIKSGFWKFGGAILEEAIKEEDGPKIKGSIMLAFAESEAEVLKALQEDIYFKEDVWDWHRVQIQPFKSAFRQPL